MSKREVSVVTEQPLTDERAQILKNTFLVAVSTCMDHGFSPLQVGAMMAGISARVLHTAGNPGAVDSVVHQLRKAAADAGHVGMQ